MTLSSRLVVQAARSTLRQADRQRRRDLEQELSAYSTPAELADMAAILARYDDGSTTEARAILGEQEVTRTAARRLFTAVRGRQILPAGPLQAAG